MNKPLNPQNFSHIFFAGRTRVTLKNNAKDTHVRLKIKEQKERKKGQLVGTGRFFVYTSILNDGDAGWDFAATFFADTKNYRLGREHQAGSQVDRIMTFVSNALKNPALFSEKGASIYHEGRCCRCAMPLTHPDSIVLGVGPDCLKHMPESFMLDLIPAI